MGKQIELTDEKLKELEESELEELEQKGFIKKREDGKYRVVKDMKLK